MLCESSGQRNVSLAPGDDQPKRRSYQGYGFWLAVDPETIDLLSAPAKLHFFQLLYIVFPLTFAHAVPSA